MLDTSTKKRIDDCRDILVGKLPDPKAQIEQITIGLIYKFMADMDKEAIELGGKAKFFADYTMPDPENPKKKIKVEFEKYSWDRLFDSKVTAAEMLKLYAEAITLMDKNPNIPQLFRDIFKNAFLPYRDPETLKMFLKTISEFEYTHSEKLGDAFEYLLSVMGSQGDAGQFRTPRHIIDFLVAVVDPDIKDSILDPACGTAGFLISAFKHILLKNTRANKENLDIFQYENNYNDTEKPFNNLGDKLTPDNRKRLIKNFAGYDISPDMVRLSLVNLYLHGFSDPHIHEYDTLSSEDRWDESYDVILANPPFMSPKGGIRPHKRFSISSNRSEVLFVDYIAEHLNPKGRAGIIVPEGVIFQSGTAYKDLRKMLVENHLYAVVSLPAGVFNPYSGVKTSILLMDRAFAKTSDEILFVKIDNDGYGLGAQRNAVKGGQLEEAVEIIKSFVKTRCVESKYASLAHAVPKTEIAKNGDYNLSGERYKTNIHLTKTKFELIKISEICDLVRGSSPRPQGDPLYYGGSVPRLMISDVTRDGMYTTPKTDFLTEEGAKKSRPMERGDVIMAVSGNPGLSTILAVDACIHDGFVGFRNLDKRLIPEFFYYVLLHQKETNNSQSIGAVFKNLNTEQIKQIQIPLPPLSVQEEIVSEIEGYQKIIDGAKMVVENYRPKIDIDPEWEMVELGEIAEVNPESNEPSSLFDEWFTYIDISCIENGTGIIDYTNKVKVSEAPSRARRVVKFKDILLSTVRPNLKAFGYVDKEPDRFIASTGFALLRTNKKCISKYLYYLVFQDFMLSQMIGSMEKGTYPSINQNDVINLKVPLPNIDIQKQIVSQIEKEQQLVNANKQLIELFEQKIKDRIGKVWGE